MTTSNKVKDHPHPNSITIKLFVQPKKTYIQMLTNMEKDVRQLAVDNFKMNSLEAQRLVIRFELASQDDVWFFDSKPLDRINQPTYALEFCISELPKYSVSASEFMGGTRESMRLHLQQEYPSSTFDDFFNTDKFIPSAMYFWET